MARFTYKGEPARTELVKTPGHCTTIKVRCSASEDPSCIKTLVPVPPATEFVVNEDIGHEITDATMLRMLRADTVRFEEIIS